MGTHLKTVSTPPGTSGTQRTTAAEALWSALPVVTLPGETMASRVAASVLIAHAYARSIARSTAEYILLALAFARQQGHSACTAGSGRRLGRDRCELLSRRASSRLFRTHEWTTHMERLLRMLLEPAAQAGFHLVAGAGQPAG